MVLSGVPFEKVPAEESARQGQKRFMDVGTLFIAASVLKHCFWHSGSRSCQGAIAPRATPLCLRDA